MTGATSMLGIALINECIKEKIEVLAIVRKQSHHIERLPESNFVKICECNLDGLSSIMKTSKPYDVFYHMAWDYTLKEQRDNPVLQEENIRHTLDAVHLAQRLGCKKFVGAGSQAEYGKVDGVIRPDTPVNPLTSYGIAKYTAGMMSKKLCEQYGMIHIWGRIFSVYGRYDRKETMINYAIARFIKGKTARFSSATQMWDYLYEEDAGKIFYLIGKLVEEERVYCIANGESRPLKEFIMELKELCDADVRCEFSERVNNEGVIGLQADIEALVQDIGYRPKVRFKKGMEDIIQYWKELEKEF